MKKQRKFIVGVLLIILGLIGLLGSITEKNERTSIAGGGAIVLVTGIVLVIIERRKKGTYSLTSPTGSSPSSTDTPNSEPLFVPSPNAQTVYFKNGKMYKVTPSDKESWYDARYLVSDGKLYDLEKVEDIKAIPIPAFNRLDPLMEGYGVTGSLDYVIRMKAGNARQKGLIAESDELYKKAIDLMQASGIYYDIKPYLYFAKDLLREGRFEESEKEEKRIYELFSKSDHAQEESKNIKKNSNYLLESCKRLKTDYVHIGYLAGTCELCAAYQARVYSLSGKDKRVPKLPSFIKDQGTIHSGCRHIITPFIDSIDGTIPFRGKECDVIQVSNRPFVDDRTAQEKENYNIYLEYLKEQSEPYITQNEKEYYRIKYLLPDLAPKSLSGYTRMKNLNSPNFAKLAEAAKKAGISIVMKE